MSTSPLWSDLGEIPLCWTQCCLGDTHVVSLAGELDLSTASQLRRFLAGVAESATAATIVVDMTEVSFIDAHSIGVLVSASTVASRAGRVWRVAGLHGLPEKVFELVGLHDMTASAAPAEAEGWADVRQ
jgi:anti-sigma B factor antagonist